MSPIEEFDGGFSFDTLEEAFAYMREQTDWANEHLADEQRALTYGSYWVRFFDIKDRVLIFGHVTPVEELPSKFPQFDPTELAQVLIEIDERLADGFLYGMAYSVIEPEGEPGDTHRAMAWPISQALFEVAGMAGWNIDELPQVAKLNIELVYQNYRRHNLAIREERRVQ